MRGDGWSGSHKLKMAKPPPEQSGGERPQKGAAFGQCLSSIMLRGLSNILNSYASHDLLAEPRHVLKFCSAVACALLVCFNPLLQCSCLPCCCPAFIAWNVSSTPRVFRGKLQQMRLLTCERQWLSLDSFCFVSSPCAFTSISQTVLCYVYSGSEIQAASFKGIERFQVDKDSLFNLLAECRVVRL